MTNPTKTSSDVLIAMHSFYKESKLWITRYARYALDFNADIVERSLHYYDLDKTLNECSVLILTANKIEQNILTYKLYQEINRDSGGGVRLKEIYADGCVYQFATIQEINIVHIHPNSTSSFTQSGSANAIRSALNRFRPKLVVSLGVAFGIDCTREHFGDVLLSSAIIPYDVFNKDTNGDITLRSNDFYKTHEALNAWDVLMRTKHFSLEDKAQTRKSLIQEKLEFDWKFGTMLSGGSVLSNEVKQQALLRAAEKVGENEIIGGEMEGIGIYFECENPKIPCIVIKGICDWGAEKNSWDAVIQLDKQEHNTCLAYPPITNDLFKDCVQAYAMDHATEALLRLLRFDSKFLDSFLPSQEYCSYIQRNRFSRIKNFFKLYQKKVVHISFNCLIILLMFILFDLFFVKMNLENRSQWIVLSLEFSLLLLFSSIYSFVRKTRIPPLQVYHNWVNISFVDYNTIRLVLNNSCPIFNVIVSWWQPSGKIVYGIQEFGDLRDNTTIDQTERSINKKTILQFEYNLANGNHYIHLISMKTKKNFFNQRKQNYFCERIYQRRSGKDSLIHIQNRFS